MSLSTKVWQIHVTSRWQNFGHEFRLRPNIEMRFKHLGIPSYCYWNPSRHSCPAGGSTFGDLTPSTSTHVCVSVCAYSPFTAHLAASSPSAHLSHPLLMNTSHFLLSHLSARHCPHHKGPRSSYHQRCIMLFGFNGTGRPPSCSHPLPANPLSSLHCPDSPLGLTSSQASSAWTSVLVGDTKHDSVNPESEMTNDRTC